MFKRMKKISSKLLTAFILVTIISSISGIVGVILVSVTDSSYSKALVNFGFAQGSIGKLGMAINENRAYVRDIVFLTEEDQLQTAKKQIDDNVAKTNELLDEVRPTNTSEAAKQLFAEIESDIAAYRTSRDQVVEHGMANDQEAAYDLWINTASPIISKIAEDVDTLLQMNTDAGTIESANLSNTSYILISVMIGVCLVAFIISITMAIFIARSISRPVVAIAETADKLAHGDLDVHIEVDSQDELGSLATSFDQMSSYLKSLIGDLGYLLGEMGKGNFDIHTTFEYVGQYENVLVSIRKITFDLSDILNQISQASDQVASGSDQVSSGAQALSQGATEQASSIEELSATISEISDQVKNNAENARNASTLTNQAGSDITLSNEKMAEMISAMEVISQKSQQISKIIKTIEDIASQTNILALNAAVEAARAGAAGKGFAVVAEEVRNLASKSAEAAKDTTTLIEETVKAVEGGKNIADGTADSIRAVAVGAQQVVTLVDAIARASGDQALSVSQVTQGVEQISAVVQTNSATAEESAAASEELNGQAQMLRDLVGRFNLRKESANQTGAHAEAHAARHAPKQEISSNYDSKY